jgi:hypothetical protein
MKVGQIDKGCAITYSESYGVFRVHSKKDLHGGVGAYRSTVSVSWIGKSRVYLFAAHGEMKVNELCEVFRMLMNKGAKKAFIEREAGRRFPGAKKIDEGGETCMWLIPSIEEWLKRLGYIQ